MISPWPVGKLPAEELARLLTLYASPGDRVVVGARVGEDVAVIDFGDRSSAEDSDTYLVAKTDPITFATDAIGWYVVQVNANDIACAGAVPRWFLATLLLPEGRTDAALVESIFAQMAQACQELGISLCGGHSEITYGLERPIVVGQMLGEVSRDGLITTSGAQPGDDILLTKGIAVEGTAIIAREKSESLSDRYSAAFLSRCADFLRRPGISVLRDARIAISHASVHAMHDPTEGGLATGLWELAEAAGIGLEIVEAAIPVLPETAALCQTLRLDPLGLIASGALLISLAPADSPRVIAALHQDGIGAAVIGRAVEGEAGCHLLGPQGWRPLPRFARDEIARLFE
jgi:hydrogenase expression/formation protein HypE